MCRDRVMQSLRKFSGYTKKPWPWCFSRVFVPYCVNNKQWELGPGCVRLPLILLAIIHGHLSLFMYSCKPKDDNPSGDLEDYSDHFFFQWSKEGAMNYVLFTASGGVFDIFIGLLQRSKFVFLIPLRTCTMRRMQFTHLCLVLNS